ncbi:MAG: hypothetical protein U9Q63_00745, partial [Patescibacteria group bacterium]|nr:hypothetical protein [Patescibacteria group bacterium]
MQKTKPAPTSLWLLSFLLLFLFTPSPIHAQTTSLSIWPPLLQATIQPGKSITQVYRLKNLGDDTTITTTIVPFAPTDEFGHVKLYGSELAPPFFSFQNADIDTFPTTIPLKAGQTKELVLKIRIPENQPEADHYLTFLFKSNTIGLIGGTGTTNQATIGSNILLTISKTGQPIKTAKIEEFKALQGDTLLNLLDSFSPTSFLLRIKNTGKTRFKVVGQVEIYNTFKKKVAILPLREDNILADSTRQIITDPNTPKWSPIFPFGLYSATATITPQDSTNTISTTITFLILPYKALLIIL